MNLKSLFLSGAAGLAILSGAYVCPCGAGSASAAEPAATIAGSRSVAFGVEGMTCASCSASVKMSLERLDGVKDVKVSVPDKQAVVEYDPAKVTPAQMVEAVNKLGYKASAPSGS